MTAEPAGTSWLAVYGAVLSTAVAAWQAVQWWLDRTRVHVSCYLAKRVGNAVLASSHKVVMEGTPPPGWLPDHLTKRFIAVSVRNTGGQPVVVKTVGGRMSDDTGFVGLDSPVPLPHVLPPGDSVLLAVPLFVAPGRVMDLEHLKEVGVWDGLGRFRGAKLTTLKAEYKEWITQAEPDGGENG